MEGIIAFYGHPYMIIGIIVSIFNFNRLAKSIANSQSVWTGQYWASGSTGRNKPPGIPDYIGAIIWSFLLIPVWPVIVFFYLLTWKD